MTGWAANELPVFSSAEVEAGAEAELGQMLKMMHYESLGQQVQRLSQR